MTEPLPGVERPAWRVLLARLAVDVGPLREFPAFRWGDLVYGVQFHLEFTEPMIQRLATEPESRDYIAQAGVDPQKVVAESATHVRRLGGVVQKVFSEFFSQCGL